MLLAVDLLIAFTVLEAVALWCWQRSGRGGVSPADLLPNIAAGACLMAALRCALAGAGWSWIALSICGAGLAHAADLKRRWQRAPHGPGGVLQSRGAVGALGAVASAASPRPSASSATITRIPTS